MECYFGEGVNLNAGFDIPAQRPIDYRLLYPTWNESDLSDIPANRLYVGMIVSDISTGTVKVLKEIPSTDSFANQCVWEEVGKTYIHPGKEQSDTSSSVSPGNSGTFSVVDSVTRDSSGHVSGINVKTVTLPAGYVHPTVTVDVSTSSKTLAHSGSFLAVTTLSVDSSGHLSSINVSTLTLPASGNTDYKVSTTTSNSSVYLSGATTTALTTAS